MSITPAELLLPEIVYTAPKLETGDDETATIREISVVFSLRYIVSLTEYETLIDFVSGLSRTNLLPLT